MTKVLIFESDHAFAVELRTGLSTLGCTVQVFKEGATGLMAAAQGRPDLALVSADLRPMNGFSICNKLKKDPVLRSVPVILFSAEQSDEAFEQHRKLPWRADDYVRKPVAITDMLARIRALVPIGAAPVPGAAPPALPDTGPAFPIDDPQSDFLQYGLGEGDEDEATTMDPAPRSSSSPSSDERGSRLPAPSPAAGLSDSAGWNAATLDARVPAPPAMRGSLHSTQILEEPDARPYAQAPAVRSAPPGYPAPPSPSAASAPPVSSGYPPSPAPPPESASAHGYPPVPIAPAPAVAAAPPPDDPAMIDLDESSIVTAAHHVVDARVFAGAFRPESDALPATPPAPEASDPPAVEPLRPSALPPEPVIGSAPPRSSVPPPGEASASAVLQLRQALVQAHQELQRMRPQVTELGRARVELGELRRELAVAREVAKGPSDADLADLRERLQRRDDELLGLREEVTARQRELQDAQARVGTVQAELVALRDRALELEQRSAEATARIDGLLAEKALAEGTSGDLRETVRKLGEQLNERTTELREQRAAFDAELARQQSAQAEAARQVEERARLALASGDERLAHAVAELEARLAASERAVEVARLDAEAQCASLRASLERDGEARIAAVVEQARSDAAIALERHGAMLAERDAEHAAAFERLRQEHADTLQARMARHAEQLAGLQEQLRMARLEADANLRRSEGVAEQLAHSEKLRRDQASKVTSLEAEIRRGRDESDEARLKADAVEAERTGWSLALEEARRGRDDALAQLASLATEHHAERVRLAAEHEARLVDERASREESERARVRLAEEHAALVEERDELAHSAQRRAGRIAELERELGEQTQRQAAELAALRREVRAELEGELGRAHAELQSAQAGLQRARERWSEDRVALQKARDAITALIAAAGPEEP